MKVKKLIDTEKNREYKRAQKKNSIAAKEHIVNAAKNVKKFFTPQKIGNFHPYDGEDFNTPPAGGM